MKKKILILGLVVLLFLMLVSLTGCGKNETNENTLTNESESVETEQNDTENTFKVGNYTLKYGRYTDGNVMVVNIKEDGTLYLNAVEQEYTIEGDTIKLKNLDLKVTSNDGFDHVVDGKVLTSYIYSKNN